MLLPRMVCNALVEGGRRSGAGQQAMRLGSGNLLEQLPSSQTHDRNLSRGSKIVVIQKQKGTCFCRHEVLCYGNEQHSEKNWFMLRIENLEYSDSLCVLSWQNTCNGTHWIFCCYGCA